MKYLTLIVRLRIDRFMFGIETIRGNKSKRIRAIHINVGPFIIHVNYGLAVYMSDVE